MGKRRLKIRVARRIPCVVSFVDRQVVTGTTVNYRGDEHRAFSERELLARTDPQSASKLVGEEVRSTVSALFRPDLLAEDVFAVSSRNKLTVVEKRNTEHPLHVFVKVAPP